MKKLSMGILAIMLAAALVLSSCASAPPRPTTSAPPNSYTQPPMTSYAPATSAPPPSSYRPPSAGGSQPPVVPTIVVTVPPQAPAPAQGFQFPWDKAPATSSAPRAPAATTAAPTAAYPGPLQGGGSASAPNSGYIGLATGGAKDVNNFRDNIRNNYLPLPTDVTYEGLFYDYYFDTGAMGTTNKLFAPSYSTAVTRDPLSHQTEYYLAVGLNSGLKESDFQRKKLNLVIVLDNSGSMGELYTQYYYDRTGNKVDAYAEEGINRQTKMASATDSVVSILNQLGSDDRFAIVLFNSNASLVKPMGPVNRTDMRSVCNNVLDIAAGGNTNLAAGLQLATQQFNNFFEMNNYEYENRIIVLTDAQPNTGDFTSSGLFNIAASNANNHIYTTYIGIGVDFNSQLIEQLTKIKGANYYSVHSPREFRQRMNEEFNYMVTPLVFNVQLNFESRGWRIEKVFGSPEANAATGSLMKINTLFPSKSEGGENKGGLVLLKLSKTSIFTNESIYLKTSYEDRNGRTDGSTATINLETTQPESFDNSGIRKGVLLVRYASLMQNWTLDERQHVQYINQSWNPCINGDTGIVVPAFYNSQWERQSLPLRVSSPYRQIFKDFSRYFSGEMEAIRDNTLGQELDTLNSLCRY
jgi:Ca-activated chloride channel homolog